MTDLGVEKVLTAAVFVAFCTFVSKLLKHLRRAMKVDMTFWLRFRSQNL